MTNQRPLTCAVAFGLFLLGAIAPAQASAALRGPLNDGASGGRVVVRIKSDRPKPLFVRMIDVPLDCDDGTVSIRTVELKGTIRANGKFLVAKYSGPGHAGGTRSFTDLRGRFVGTDLAKGTFTWLSVSFDDFTPSCSTPYPLPWRAER